MKCLSISVHSISFEKGDWTILFNARVLAFMAVFGHPSLSLLSDIEFLSLDSVNLSLDTESDFGVMIS